MPDLPGSSAIAAEGKGRQVRYQADFWIAWGLFLSESPNEFADHKENTVCLITELQSVPSLPPSYVPHQGFIVPFQIDVLISHSPIFVPLISLSRAAALNFASPCQLE